MDDQTILYYFDMNGRGCYIRAILSFVKAKWIDKRLTNSEWSSIKESGKFEFSQLPVLEVGEHQIYQGHSISIFLGKRYKLFYDDIWKDTEIISFILSTEDLISKIITYEFYENDEERKNYLKETFLKNVLPRYLDYYDKRLKGNGGKYFVGDKTTLCEIYFTIMVFTFLLREDNKCMEKHTGLFKLVESYYSNELKEYFENMNYRRQNLLFYWHVFKKKTPIVVSLFTIARSCRLSLLKSPRIALADPLPDENNADDVKFPLPTPRNTLR